MPIFFEKFDHDSTRHQQRGEEKANPGIPFASLDQNGPRCRQFQSIAHAAAKRREIAFAGANGSTLVEGQQGARIKYMLTNDCLVAWRVNE
jgi:hypothetical protein